MSGHRSYRLHLGMTTPEEVAAYIDAFLAAFSQGSADAFGRLSKVRSELKKLLWTHPSGSLAGIADALEYLNQLLQEHYGISLETGTPDEDQLGQQQQSVEPAEVHDFASRPPAELTAGMLHQATQTDASSTPLMPPSSSEGQQSMPMSQDISNAEQRLSRVTSKGSEAETSMDEIPAKGTASGMHEGQESSQPVLANPAVQKDSEPLSQPPQKGETTRAGEAPDSLAMDTSTLHELTVLPSEHGRIPVSLRSPLPMAAPPARTAKGKGMDKSPIASARLTRKATPSPAREVSQIGSRQVLSSRAQGQARQLIGTRQKGQTGTGTRRTAQPLARKQLHFQETEPATSRRASSTGQETQRERQGVKQLQRITKQQAKPEPTHMAASAAQAAEQQAVKPQVLHARSPSSPMSQHDRASSDSDTPRSAPDRLPQPVPQTEGNIPLHDPRHDLQRPELRAAQPAQPSCIVLGPSGSAQGAGMLHGSPQLQAGALAMAETVGQPQQLQQQQSHGLHGMGAWIEQMTTMGAVMAASASAAKTNGSANPATQFQHGSTQFNHCHFTQSVPLPAPATKPASQSAAAPSHSQTVAVRSEPSSGALTRHEWGIQTGFIGGGQEGQEPQEHAAIGLDARAALQARTDRAVETEAGTSTEAVAVAAPDRTPAQGRAAGQDSRLHCPLRKAPRRSVHFKPAVPTLRPHGNSPQRPNIASSTSHSISVPGRTHAAGQSRASVPNKQRPKDTSQGERDTAADRSEARSVTKQSRPKDAPRSQKKTAIEATDAQQQPAFDYAKALAALDSHHAGTLQQLRNADSHRHGAAFEPLADLLLRPEALIHMNAESHGAASTGEVTEARQARGRIPHQSTSQQHRLEDASMQTLSAEHASSTSGEPSAAQLQVAGHEIRASLEPSAVQLQLVERIADAVAARLSRKAMQNTAESPLPGLSAAQSSQSAASTHAEPDTACIDGQSEQQLSPGTSSKVAADPSPRYGQSDRSPMQQVSPGKHAEAAVGVVPQSCEDTARQAQACEADFLAALLQGSPGDARISGQSSRPKACEEDFLAALLLGSPGSARHMRHAASPGLMHRDMCRQPDSRSAEISMSAASSAEPWSAHWVGKLTREEMETAVQEVIAEELQGLFKEWHCPSELLPQVCSQMASSSLEVCQQGKACELSPKITPHPAQPTEEHDHSTGHSDSSSAGEQQRQLSAQALVSDSDPEAHSSSLGDAAQTPTKEAFMHAVLQSLSDICKDGLRDGLLHSQPKSPAHVPTSPGRGRSNWQTPGTADAALGESFPAQDLEGTAPVYRNLHKPGIAAAALEESAPASDHKGASRMADAKESLSEPAIKVQGLQRKAPKAVLKKQLRGQAAMQLAASTGPHSAVGQMSAPREAGPLVRLKATLRKPKIASKPAAAPQRALQPAGPQNRLPAQPSGGTEKSRGEREPQTERAVDALSGSWVAHERRESGESETESVAEGHSAEASTAVESAGTSSWHTEHNGDSHSFSGSTSIESTGGVPAQQALPDRPFLAAECSQSQLRMDVSSNTVLGMAEAEVHSLAVRGPGRRNKLSCGHESASGSRHQHKHPPKRRHMKAEEPYSPAASTGPASHSADETREQYRRQKALAAKKKGKAIRHVHPSARREGTAERRRRLIAEAGLTDSLLFSSDSLSDTGSERCKSSHRSSKSSDSDIALSSISSGASTPRAVSERKLASGSGASDTRMSIFTQPNILSAHRTEGGKHDTNVAYLGISESSSSSQVVSTGASLVHQLSHDERRGVISLSSNDMTLESVSMKENRTGIKTPWELPTLWTECHKHATWGASHHLQDRLAAIRTLPFRFT